MNNKIRVRLRGCRPTRGGIASMIGKTDTALEKLGWKYSRIHFRQREWFRDEIYVNNYLEFYRNAGLYEKYIGVSPASENKELMNIKISSFGHDEDPEQEQLICRLWSDPNFRFRWCRELVYYGILLDGEEGAISGDINLWSNFYFIDVTVAEGYGRRTAWRISEKFAAETGMTVDRRMSKSVWRGIF